MSSFQYILGICTHWPCQFSSMTFGCFKQKGILITVQIQPRANISPLVSRDAIWLVDRPASGDTASHTRRQNVQAHELCVFTVVVIYARVYSQSPAMRTLNVKCWQRVVRILYFMSTQCVMVTDFNHCSAISKTYLSRWRVCVSFEIRQGVATAQHRAANLRVDWVLFKSWCMIVPVRLARSYDKQGCIPKEG